MSASRPSFVHLHVHSDFSPLEGAGAVDELCALVRADGGDALALTDTNGLYGAVRFVAAARQAGLKPILGAAVRHPSGRAVVLAKTAEGYENLCQLLTARHCDGGFNLAAALCRHGDGLVILSDDAAVLASLRAQR